MRVSSQPPSATIWRPTHDFFFFLHWYSLLMPWGRDWDRALSISGGMPSNFPPCRAGAKKDINNPGSLKFDVFGMFNLGVIAPHWLTWHPGNWTFKRLVCAWICPSQIVEANRLNVARLSTIDDAFDLVRGLGRTECSPRGLDYIGRHEIGVTARGSLVCSTYIAPQLSLASSNPSFQSIWSLSHSLRSFSDSVFPFSLFPHFPP